MNWISVDIDADDFMDELSTDDLIIEIVSRMKDDPEIITDLIERMNEKGVKANVIKTWTNHWTEKIERYLHENCQDLGGVFETEKKLGIE